MPTEKQNTPLRGEPLHSYGVSVRTVELRNPVPRTTFDVVVNCGLGRWNAEMVAERIRATLQPAVGPSATKRSAVYVPRGGDGSSTPLPEAQAPDEIPCPACGTPLMRASRFFAQAAQRMQEAHPTPPPPSETAMDHGITLTDVLNEFEYVCSEAPDEASRLVSRKGVEAFVAAEIEKARHEGFRKAERAYFDD